MLSRGDAGGDRVTKDRAASIRSKVVVDCCRCCSPRAQADDLSPCERIESTRWFGDVSRAVSKEQMVSDLPRRRPSEIRAIDVAERRRWDDRQSLMVDSSLGQPRPAVPNRTAKKNHQMPAAE